MNVPADFGPILKLTKNNFQALMNQKPLLVINSMQDI